MTEYLSSNGSLLNSSIVIGLKKKDGILRNRRDFLISGDVKVNVCNTILSECVGERMPSYVLNTFKFQIVLNQPSPFQAGTRNPELDY